MNWFPDRDIQRDSFSRSQKEEYSIDEMLLLAFKYIFWPTSTKK